MLLQQALKILQTIFYMNKKVKENRLVVNRWRTPDGTYLQSKHRHDYVQYEDKNGETYIVDGGTDYIRMSQNIVPMECCCLCENDPIEEIRKYLLRGTFNSKGDSIWVPLDRMSDSHVQNCIIYNEELGLKDDVITECYRRELEYRKAHSISIPESTYDDIEY
jgi:hypothetical protein